MSVAAVLFPVFVQVALTLGVLVWLVVLRGRDLRGPVTARAIALREPNWPARTTQVGNAFSSQFELPILFYVLTILAMATRHADLLFVVMAWIFVLSRLIHAYEHTTSNRIRLRGPFFGIGVTMVTLMWIIFAARILLGLG
jgi:hypothetical protein